MIRINIYSPLIINIKYVVVIHIIRLYGAKEKLKPGKNGMNRPLEAVPKKGWTILLSFFTFFRFLSRKKHQWVIMRVSSNF